MATKVRVVLFPEALDGLGVSYMSYMGEGKLHVTRYNAPVQLWSVDRATDLISVLVDRLLPQLKRELEVAVGEQIEEALQQVPYPRACQCEKHPTHVADDCHVHNENPKHFFGDFAFDCTCP